jgi:hypothetical protein
MKPFGLTLHWYDIPPFDGGGTALRIMNSAEQLHFFRYPNAADALKDACRLLTELSANFADSDGSPEDIEKWRAMVRL